MNLNHPRAQAIALPQGGVESVVTTNRVIRNTYLLLSMTLLFAAVTAGLSVALKLPHPGIILTLVGYFRLGDAFDLWMAFVNGGGLIVGGLWMRRI